MMYVPIVLRARGGREAAGQVVSTFSMIFTCVRSTVERLSNSGFYSAGTAYTWNQERIIGLGGDCSLTRK